MSKLKNQILRLIQDKAAERVAVFASQYVRAKPEEKEDIQAGIQFERWMSELCEECLETP